MVVRIFGLFDNKRVERSTKNLYCVTFFPQVSFQLEVKQWVKLIRKGLQKKNYIVEGTSVKKPILCKFLPTSLISLLELPFKYNWKP